MNDYYEGSKERRFECYLKLFELENNYYCAVKHLREYMKDLTLEAWKLESEDIMDCQAAEFMEPEVGRPGSLGQGRLKKWI